MRILGSVVAPSAALMAFCDSKIMGCGSIRPQLIRDELIWDKERQSSGPDGVIVESEAMGASLFTPATRMIAIHYDLSPHQWNVPRSHKFCSAQEKLIA